MTNTKGTLSYKSMAPIFNQKLRGWKPSNLYLIQSSKLKTVRFPEISEFEPLPDIVVDFTIGMNPAEVRYFHFCARITGNEESFDVIVSAKLTVRQMDPLDAINSPLLDWRVLPVVDKALEQTPPITGVYTRWQELLDDLKQAMCNALNR